MLSGLFVLQHNAARNDEPEAHYEFRCWPGRPDTILSRLLELDAPHTCERRTDIYLLSGLRHRILPKLRGGERLEIKSMEHIEWPLQYWRTVIAADFPLDEKAASLIAAGLRTSAPLSRAACMSPALFIASLSGNSPDVAIINVEKTRLLFHLEDFRVELTVARFGVRRWLSVALEGTSRRPMTTAMAFLQIADLPNVHYGDALPRKSPGVMRKRIERVDGYLEGVRGDAA